MWGPYHYFLTLVDDFSKTVWVYLLQFKTEVNKFFRHFFAMIERQFETDVKIVRSKQWHRIYMYVALFF